MFDEEEVRQIQSRVSKYYEVEGAERDGDFLVFRVSNFDLYGEEHFTSLVRELEKQGYVAFTTAGGSEITIVRKTWDSRAFPYRYILLAATLATVIYSGYSYSSATYEASTFAGNLQNALIFFFIPVLTFLLAREIPKAMILKMNGMEYGLSIFIPDPITLGTLGSVNAPNRPYPSRKVMLYSGLSSLLSGFIIALFFISISTLKGLPQIDYSRAINTPFRKLLFPLLYTGILDHFLPPWERAEHPGLCGGVGRHRCHRVQRAPPLGYLDGGLIFSAVLGRKSVYLSYISVALLVVLGLYYPFWILLAVFAIVFGIRGPDVTEQRLPPTAQATGCSCRSSPRAHSARNSTTALPWGQHAVQGDHK
ncbi:hypothetical protein [Thermogymnomonas acidicola]|uniref:hypothetical protein n=1 Tax=Thermogymnomonas acidicola TaxID=399579 RepID=UPI000946405F|nr:hypothetical protein [Thermogymnomonas acidicola]